MTTDARKLIDQIAGRLHNVAMQLSNPHKNEVRECGDELRALANAEPVKGKATDDEVAECAKTIQSYMDEKMPAHAIAAAVLTWHARKTASDAGAGMEVIEMVERGAAALYGLGKNKTPFSKTTPEIQETMRALARTVIDAARGSR